MGKFLPGKILPGKIIPPILKKAGKILSGNLGKKFPTWFFFTDRIFFTSPVSGKFNEAKKQVKHW